MSFLGAMFKSIEAVDRATLAEKTTAAAMERASLAEKRGMMGSDLKEPLMQPDEAYSIPEIPESNIRSSDGPTSDVFKDADDEFPEDDDVFEDADDDFPEDQTETLVKAQDKINDERTALEAALSKNPREQFRKKLQTKLDALPKTDTRGLYHKIAGAPFSGSVQRGLDATLEGAPESARNYVKSVTKDITTNMENTGNALRYKAVGAEPPVARPGAFDAAGGKGPLHRLTSQPVHETVSSVTEVARDTSIKAGNFGINALKKGAIVGGGLVVATGGAYGIGSQLAKKHLG